MPSLAPPIPHWITPTTTYPWTATLHHFYNKTTTTNSSSHFTITPTYPCTITPTMITFNCYRKRSTPPPPPATTRLAFKQPYEPSLLPFLPRRAGEDSPRSWYMRVTVRREVYTVFSFLSSWSRVVSRAPSCCSKASTWPSSRDNFT